MSEWWTNFEGQYEGEAAPAGSVGQGYALGGYIATWASSIEGLDFESDAILSIAVTLSLARQGSSGASSTVKGYAMGGTDNGAHRNTIDGITFVSETAFTSLATLSIGRTAVSSSYSDTKGYCMGGYGSGVRRATIDGVAFAADSSFTSSATLSSGRTALNSGASSDTKGFCFGGYPGGSSVATIDGVVFTSDTSFTASGSLSTARNGAAGVFDETNAFTLGAEDDIGAVDYIDKMDFATESCALIAAELSEGKFNIAVVSSTSKGYALGGGIEGDPTYECTLEIEYIDFATDTKGVSAATLATRLYDGSGVQLNVS